MNQEKVYPNTIRMEFLRDTKAADAVFDSLTELMQRIHPEQIRDLLVRAMFVQAQHVHREGDSNKDFYMQMYALHEIYFAVGRIGEFFTDNHPRRKGS
jgi:hypothetical protein